MIISISIYRSLAEGGKQLDKNCFIIFYASRKLVALYQPESMPSTWFAFARFEGGKRVFFQIHYFMEKGKSINDLSQLKKGDVVAFEYEGNTAIARMADNEGLFMYAVGLWFDSNCFGEKDNVWECDYIQNIDLDVFNNLRYANTEEQLRYYRVVYEWLEGSRVLDGNKIKSLERKLNAINQICGNTKIV